MNTATVTTPSIYVACLASYNSGILHGKWIELTENDTTDQVDLAIEAILKSSPIPNAEEWAIHDSEGLGDVSESESNDGKQLSRSL